MTGRPPIPTQLKMLRGSRVRNKREAKPVGDLKAPPEHFNEQQRDVWRYAIRNAPAGLLRRLDASILEIWCVSHVMHRRAVVEVQRLGMLVKAPNTGLPIENPYVWTVNKQAQIMLRAAEQLGFSPASRTRIQSGADVNEPLGDWKDLATG